MNPEPFNYSIFFDFIESYLPAGFLGIKEDDAIMQKLETSMEVNHQYFSIIELGGVKFLFTSKGSLPLIGVKPDELNPTHYLEVTHPDDIKILEWARIQIFKLEQEILKAKKGSGLLSYTLRMKSLDGEYHNYLGQDYLFYGASPHPKVYALQIGTNVDWYDMKDINFHRYVGYDLSLFRFPDIELLKFGLLYTKRELEIIKMIESGLSSKQIAEKLDLSLHTVNTHRYHIIEKSDKPTISDLIYELKSQGVL